ncbi:putative gustatory receptor 28b [Belonocnema kinseyi]|uniref:putative gustatory receptor 28b n=1 Tax=Belonocnema kinseyi TaxID=2817044 RepID=UPI00143E056D|nr:putative gustatory receptor 28b [Belonocnema kinseyi]
MKPNPKKKLKYSLDFIKWSPKNIHDSMLPIMILNWIMGLSIWEYPLGKPRPVITFIYVLLMNSLYWFLVLSAQQEVNLENLTTIGKNIFAVIIYFNTIIAVSSIIIGWYHYKELKANIERLEQLDVALERLGLPNNYHKIFINTMIKAAMWLITIVVLVANDIQFLLSKFDWLKSLHIMYMIHCPLHLNSVVDFTFTSLVNLLGIRFENINLLLKRHLEKNPEPKTVRQLYPKYSRVSALVMSTEYSDRLNEKQLEIQLLILSRYLHMELTNISWEVNKIYQKQMMMEMGAYLIILTGLSYYLFTILFFSIRTFHSKIAQVINGCIWSIVYAYKLLNITSTCAKVSLESQKTRDILYELKILNEDKEFKEEIEQFSLQLTQRPLVFSTCGLSTLDYPFVQRFIGSVTTYLVILIQFSPEISE